MSDFPNPVLLDIRAAEPQHKLLHVADALGRIYSLIECAGFAADSSSSSREVGNAISATLLTASTDLQAAIDALEEIRLPNGEQEGDFAEAA